MPRFVGMNSMAFKVFNYQVAVNINKRTEPRKPLIAILFIPAVCALHEQRAPVVSSGKSLKIQINFTKEKNNGCIFPEGVKPLCAGVTS